MGCRRARTSAPRASATTDVRKERDASERTTYGVGAFLGAMRALALRVPEIDAEGRLAARERTLKVLGSAPSIPANDRIKGTSDRANAIGMARYCDFREVTNLPNRPLSDKANGGRLPARLPVTMALLPRT